MPRSMFSKDYAILIQLMADIRKEMGKTQVDVSTALGKPQSFISKIENGERRMDLIEMIAIADAIGMNSQQILKRLENEIQRPVEI
ncbi:MAG: helix-turn-helix transcriptional regulator [Hyphomicrobiales bacterium]